MEKGLAWIEANTAELYALAQRIWAYAELGQRELRSAADQAEFLRREGFRVELGLGTLPSALVATWGEGQPAIGYLGEYDALPGLSQRTTPQREPLVAGGAGHGCGHNLLGVGSLGAAAALARELEAGGVPGTVRYYGCPAEETLDGKAIMAAHGAFAGLDVALTWHPGTFNAPTAGSSQAMDSVRFSYFGRAAHAAGAPHLGISALDAVELLNIGANYLREHVSQEARIHYVVTHGGDQPNVVPPYAQVWYYIRAPRRQEVEELTARVQRIAEGAALMTGARLESAFDPPTYEVLPNDVLTELLEASLRRVGPPRFSAEEHAFAAEISGTITRDEKIAALRAGSAPAEYWDLTLHEEIASPYDRGRTMPGSTDVGSVSWIVPTGQISAATWAVGTPGHSWQVTAQAGMGIGLRGMIVAARALAVAGYELATQPDLLRRASEQFVRDTAGRAYAPAAATRG